MSKTYSIQKKKNNYSKTPLEEDKIIENKVIEKREEGSFGDLNIFCKTKKIEYDQKEVEEEQVSNSARRIFEMNEKWTQNMQKKIMLATKTIKKQRVKINDRVFC